MSDHKVLEVRFECDAQNGPSPRFTVPVSVQKFLGIDASDELWIEVWSSSKGISRAKTKLKSGPEIYGDGLEDCCERGERISVRVSKA
jgi:hypothetical protein